MMETETRVEEESADHVLNICSVLHTFAQKMNDDIYILF
jgi:hypothetical protein